MRMSDRKADRLFHEGRFEESATHLQEGLKKAGPEGKDSLLYYLDIGLALHTAGKYEESNQYFLKADDLAEIKDYTSLANEGASLLTSENSKHYKGEDFEKVLINTYLAMNFALMGEFESALVEARKVNRKLRLMVTEGKRKYKQNAFARYLSAILYETRREWNDAYIDYKKALELEPSHPTIGRDLWRVAKLLGMGDEMEKWEEQFNLSRQDREKALLGGPRSGKGEIIVLYENGISPVKRPNPQFTSLPRFYPRFNPVRLAEVQVDGVLAGTTFVLHDIERTAIQNLEEKYSGMVAKRLAGVVTKEVVANQIGKQTNSPGLGLLASFIFHASDQADLRSWHLLPRDLQIARVVVDPGVHDVKIMPVGAASSLAKTVHVEAGQKVFVGFRYDPGPTGVLFYR